MPEAPEVQQVLSDLKKKLQDAAIARVEITHPKLASNMDPERFAKLLEGEHFRSFSRRGKYLIFEMDHVRLIAHLRMEGKFLLFDEWPDDPFLNKHTHARFFLEDGRILAYQDTRKFGRMALEDLSEPSLTLKPIGLDVLDPRADGTYLYNKLHKRRIDIKSALLDQKVVAGIGNIYANEILFLSRIHPARPCDTLTLCDYQQIAFQMRHIMELAMALGGSTIRTFAHPDGHGSFQDFLSIHEKEICPVCQGPVERQILHQRSAYLCPNCQKPSPSPEASDQEKVQ